MFVDSAKVIVTVQPLGVVVPLFVTETSIWYEVAWLLETTPLQVIPPELVVDEELELLEDELELLEELEELDELLEEELEELLLEDELEELLVPPQPL